MASSDTIPWYRELYSISDLHLGGSAPRAQIFCQGPRLKAFIESLASRPGPFALVIAGDLFDSLPHLTGTGSYVAVDGAAGIVRTIMTDAAFAPVFAGLRTFLGADEHELIILIGNHDLEIALPEAQEQLLRQIAPTPAARGRVRFLTSGTGFRCRVGTLTVFITHGNEADPWNHVDYEALRKVAHARMLGRPFEAKAWIPNAGTKLVVDVMNKVKEIHPFIDLLKPETKAAVKILSILDPKTLGRLFDALPAFGAAIEAHAGPHTVLGADRRPIIVEPEVVRLLGEAARTALEPTVTDTSGRIRIVEEMQDRGKLPINLVSDDDRDTLSF
jgi:hypothetical protein